MVRVGGTIWSTGGVASILTLVLCMQVSARGDASASHRGWWGPRRGGTGDGWSTSRARGREAT